MSSRNTEDIVADIFRLEGQSDSLAVRREKRKLMKELLQMLPQGPGSGLNADLLDDMHAEDIIARARTGFAGGGGGADGMTVHGNEYHTPNFGLVKESHITFIALADEKTF